ncbi:hypothetical protein AB2N04_08445 [Nitratireductor sp. GISD-1A_MAKvit]|uniref:hypothetical protein n=1 Tax=Nitratireductor sp. GISD-1A_MAKvit TaxID=3234198 RepID=UPI0034672AAE
MIKTVLLFFLGFFVAGFVALLLAPLVWRRAVRLTTRRIEASMPLSTNELEAEKDRLRAEHAMATRRLEMRVDTLNRKSSSQLIELSRVTDEARQLAEERDRQDATITRLQGEIARQREILAENTSEIAELRARLEEALGELGERNAALGELSDQFEEERLRSSSRQIELASRETELHKLEDELAAARRDRKEAIRAAREADTARKEALAGLKVAEKRYADLQKKLESQMRLLYEHEEKLRRKESELGRLRKDAEAASAASLSRQGAQRLKKLEDECVRLRRELADKSVQLRSVIGSEGDMSVASAQGQEAEREKLQSRIARLMQENKKLRAALPRKKPNNGGAKEKTQADDALREEIHSLAAEVVNLTAALEGEGSSINSLLAAGGEDGGGERPLSLAERIRALRDQATQ